MKEKFGLYLILTDPVSGYEAAAQAAVDAGLRYLQLRMKDTPQETVLQTARALRKITQHSETRFIINDDLSVAMACDADGIHLGQTDMSVSEARSIWNRPGKLFGLSTHSMEQALQALEEKPDYVGVGPVFPTQTKKDADPHLGTAETARIICRMPITAVAIGGITPGNLPELLDSGVENYCVVSAVNSDPDPGSAISGLSKIWKTHVF